MIPEGVEHDPTRRRLIGRRDLFRARARAEATPAVPSHAIINASRPAMGSFFEVRLGANVPGAVDLASRALDRIDELEAQLTVYNDESEVSRLNASAHRGPVPVEAGLFGLLEQAVAIGRLTRGAYDVTAGALSLAWGFTRGPRRVPRRSGPARRPRADRRQAPDPRPGGADGRLPPARRGHQPGVDRQGVRHRPRG